MDKIKPRRLETVDDFIQLKYKIWVHCLHPPRQYFHWELDLDSVKHHFGGDFVFAPHPKQNLKLKCPYCGNSISEFTTIAQSKPGLHEANRPRTDVSIFLGIRLQSEHEKMMEAIGVPTKK